MNRLALSLALALALSLTAFPALAEDDHAHVAEADGLHLVHAWTRATDSRTALVFVEIENEGEAVRTVEGGHSDVAASAALVAFSLDSGGYVPLGPVAIDPGATLELGPEGLALQLDGLSEPLREGSDLNVVVVFDTVEIPVEVVIEASDAKRHSHAGHAH